MKKLVSLIVLLTGVFLFNPIKANQQYWVYFMDNGKPYLSGISLTDPSIGWDGNFFACGIGKEITYEIGQQKIKSLNATILWSVEPITFSTEVVKP